MWVLIKRQKGFGSQGTLGAVNQSPPISRDDDDDSIHQQGKVAQTSDFMKRVMYISYSMETAVHSFYHIAVDDLEVMVSSLGQHFDMSSEET